MLLVTILYSIVFPPADCRDVSH